MHIIGLSKWILQSHYHKPVLIKSNVILTAFVFEYIQRSKFLLITTSMFCPNSVWYISMLVFNKLSSGCASYILSRLKLFHVSFSKHSSISYLCNYGLSFLAFTLCAIKWRFYYSNGNFSSPFSRHTQLCFWKRIYHKFCVHCNWIETIITVQTACMVKYFVNKH